MKFHFDIRSILTLTRKPAKVSSMQHELIRPEREWVIGLFVASTLFLSVAGYAGYDFYVQLHQTEAVPQSPTTFTTYDASLVREVLEFYGAREEVFNERAGKDDFSRSVPTSAATTFEEPAAPTAVSN